MARIGSASAQSSASAPSTSRPTRAAAQQATISAQQQLRGTYVSSNNIAPASSLLPASARPIHPLPQRGHHREHREHRGPHPLTKKEEPAPAYTPLSSTSQAKHSTYASRLKLGVTMLMQPITQSSSSSAASSSAAAFANNSITDLAALHAYGAGKRTRTQVSYAEVEQLDDPDDVVQQSGEDEFGSTAATTARGRALAQQRRSADGVSTRGSSTAITPTAALTPATPAKSWLGQAVPGNLIMVEPARKTRHIYPFAFSLLICEALH